MAPGCVLDGEVAVSSAIDPGAVAGMACEHHQRNGDQQVQSSPGSAELSRAATGRHRMPSDTFTHSAAQ